MSDILVADDDDGLRLLVSEVLRHGGHTVRPVANGAAALEEIRRSTPDLAVLDWRMGRPDGFEVCRAIKSDPRLAHLPVLILTGQGDLEDRLRGYDAGADDYLAKPFDTRELLARVAALLRLARRGLDRNPTSGLPGGEAIYDEIERRRAASSRFAVCYFDLDYFKPFADHFGFAVADTAIRAVGEAIASVADAEPEAFVGHVGGDDFVLLCASDAAVRLAEQAQARFAERLPAELPEQARGRTHYHGEDREGRPREFPLTRLSAAIVHIGVGEWGGMEQLGETVAALKREAKRAGGSGIAEATLGTPAS